MDFARQGAEVEHLMRSVKAGRIVHAYLLAGGRGCGKRTLARLLVQTLFCGAEDDARPCGRCPACKRFLSGSHPDARFVAPDGRSIGVDEVRALGEYLSRLPYEGGWHAAVIEQADRMTAGAQNALLKTLENPPRDTVFFLLTDAPGALLSTVRSRLRLVRVPPLAREACARVLCARGLEAGRAARLAGLAHGSVGRALEMDADEGYLPLVESVRASLAALTGPQSVAAAAAPFYEAKERREDVLEILETIGRDRMALDNGVFPEALEAAELGDVRVDASALLRAVGQARRMLAANVGWQSVLDEIYFSLARGLSNTGGA